jgi:Cu+-exporting ATPase
MMVKDPVCHMSVSEDKPGAKENFNGKTYFFCSNKCKATFDKNRDKFMEK